MDAVSAYYKNFIVIEEELFTKFLEAYQKYSNDIDKHENLYKKLDFVDEIDVSCAGTFANISVNTPGKCINGIFSYFRTNTFDEALEILLENFKIFWSLWLDENSVQQKNWHKDDNRNSTMKSFDEFLLNATKCHYDEVDLHPVSRLKLFKYFDRIGRIDDAKKVLMKNFQKDSVAYEYYKSYIDIKLKSKSQAFKQRELTLNEITNLRLTIKHFAHRELHRSSRSCAIKACISLLNVQDT